ncbi:MAG TPA: AAA family ATPase [Syntrophales bacterium]|nr:AAA family ATPase [Syntrophales bacterium]
MRILKVHIENYRSLKNFTLEPGPFCVLIGENNAGKSNILRALNLILGDTWPSERNFSEEDFYNQDTSQDIMIQVFFDETIEDWRNNHKAEIHGIQLRCKAYKKAVKGKPAGSLKVEFTCINENGEEVTHPEEPLQKGQQYKGRWVPVRVSGELRERLPFIYVEVLRDYNRQTPGSRWSVLRRLFNEVNTEFLNDKKEVKVPQSDGTTLMMTRKEAFTRTVRDAYKYLRTESFEEIEKRLAQNAMEHMGLAEGDGKIELHFESHDPTNAYKSLQLYVQQMGIESPAGEVGAGLQSAIVVAIFRTYEEMKKEGAIFAIEEPEVFLHPQKARYFQTVLERLSESGNQVFLTTHSPIFVQVHKPESVAVIRRTADKGTEACQAQACDFTDSERQTLRLLTEFDAERKELFFAKAVLLVEGATEKVALPLAFKALGHDINRLGISVVEVGGKTKFPLFVRVLKALHIPYAVLADQDIEIIDVTMQESVNNAKHKRWNKDIERVCEADSLFWMKPNFESELRLPKEESEKIDQAMEMFSNVTKSDIPQSLIDPIESVVNKTRST